jgi:uncharacterized protein
MKLLLSESVLKNPWKYFLLSVILLFSLAVCTPKEDSSAVLSRQGWVSDYAYKLKPEEKTRISGALASYEKETCHQIFLLIIPSLAGENIADFSQRTASAWEIGQPGLGNGFLVTIALEEGTVRIETGSAFEWFIQNGTAEKVLNEVMFPLFRQDKFVEGVELGLEEIMAAGRFKEIPENHKPGICR